MAAAMSLRSAARQLGEALRLPSKAAALSECIGRRPASSVSKPFELKDYGYRSKLAPGIRVRPIEGNALHVLCLVQVLLQNTMACFQPSA